MKHTLIVSIYKVIFQYDLHGSYGTARWSAMESSWRIGGATHGGLGRGIVVSFMEFDWWKQLMVDQGEALLSASWKLGHWNLMEPTRRESGRGMVVGFFDIDKARR